MTVPFSSRNLTMLTLIIHFLFMRSIANQSLSGKFALPTGDLLAVHCILGVFSPRVNELYPQFSHTSSVSRSATSATSKSNLLHILHPAPRHPGDFQICLALSKHYKRNASVLILTIIANNLRG